MFWKKKREEELNNKFCLEKIEKFIDRVDTIYKEYMDGIVDRNNFDILYDLEVLKRECEFLRESCNYDDLIKLLTPWNRKVDTLINWVKKDFEVFKLDRYVKEYILEKLGEVCTHKKNIIATKKILKWSYEQLRLNEIEISEVTKIDKNLVIKNKIIKDKDSKLEKSVSRRQIRAFITCINNAIAGDIPGGVKALYKFIDNYDEFNPSEALNSVEKVSIKIIIETLIKSIEYEETRKEGDRSRSNLIMRILQTDTEDEINELLKNNGYVADILFSVDEAEETGKFDVTLGYNAFGEDVCSRTFNTYLEAYRFAAIRTVLGYDIKSY